MIVMTPRKIGVSWVEAFHRGDADNLAALYREQAGNHQVPETTVAARPYIRVMFADEFETAEMQCITEHPFVDREWAILQ